MKHPKSPYFIPSARSPWALIAPDKARGGWQFIESYRTRREARYWRQTYNRNLKPIAKFRIVRLWVPTIATK